MDTFVRSGEKERPRVLLTLRGAGESEPLRANSRPPVYHKMEGLTMLKRLLFETRIGDLVLALFERWTGLAVVDVGQLQG